MYEFKSHKLVDCSHSFSIGNDSKELDKCDKPMPPYYNIKTPQQPQNPKTVKDGALVSSEGYSYVTEVPSLPSSHQRHSNASKKSDGSHHSMSGGGGGGGSGSGGHIERSESSHQHSRQRRTQRKITHNEKRYHSGKYVPTYLASGQIHV